MSFLQRFLALSYWNLHGNNIEQSEVGLSYIPTQWFLVFKNSHSLVFGNKFSTIVQAILMEEESTKTRNISSIDSNSTINRLGSNLVL